MYTVISFAIRAVIFTMQTGNTGYLYAGFISLSLLQYSKFDFRDIDFPLRFLAQGLRTLKINETEYSNMVVGLAEPKIAQFITGSFLNNAENWETEKACGYIQVNTKYGSGFIQCNYAPYRSTFYMTGMIVEIAEYIAMDKYTFGDISICEVIFPVWLDADKDEGIKKIDRGISGMRIPGNLVATGYIP